MVEPSGYRDAWRERMRLEELKRHEKNRLRKERKPGQEEKRMPWPESSKLTPDEAWRRRG